MKINSGDFRVREGDKVDLGNWPTNVEPVCNSKKHYKELLEERVEKLSALQRLHYASNRYAILLIFQAMDAAGKDGAISACDVWGQSARMPGVQLQASQRHQVAP